MTSMRLMTAGRWAAGLAFVLFLSLLPSAVVADEDPPQPAPRPAPQPDEPQPGAPGPDAPPASQPEPIEALVAACRALLQKGDQASLQAASERLEARRDDAGEAIDFWMLYARVWMARKKDPGALWNDIFAKRRQAAPKSAVFDVVRSRFETDDAKKRAAIESALERDAKSIPARTARALLYLEDDEEDEADELLQAILEDDPYALGARLALGRLYLSDGLPAEGIGHCNKALEKHPESADAYSLRSDCYRRMALNKPEVIGKALADAADAMGLDPTAARIAVFKELLQETGDAATASRSLRTHFARSKNPVLGRLLAELAFKAGDYAGALMGLAVSDPTELVTAKALAVAHARLGEADAARAACEQVLAVDSQGRLFAAQVALYLGDAAAVQEHLGSLADFRAMRLRALALAWRGEAQAIEKLAAKKIASGSREGEALLVALLQARMLRHVDADLAEALRKKLLEARFRQGRQPVEQGTEHSVDLGAAKTAGWPPRAVTWFRAPCGTFYARKGEGFGRSWSFDGGDTPSIAQSLTGEATCGAETFTCEFTFNKMDAKSGGRFVQIFEDPKKLGDFAPAEKAFASACKAYLEGNLAATEAGFAGALAVEPNWSRIKVLRAVMRALAPDSEKRDEARTATEAVKPWTDDFELRRLVIYLRAWAGDADLQTEVDALALREAQYDVRDLAGL